MSHSLTRTFQAVGRAVVKIRRGKGPGSSRAAANGRSGRAYWGGDTEAEAEGGGGWRQPQECGRGRDTAYCQGEGEKAPQSEEGEVDTQGQAPRMPWATARRSLAALPAPRGTRRASGRL